jgi:hypothetical protein
VEPNLDLDFVELYLTAHLIEIFPIRLVADQIIGAHVIKSARQT